MSYLEAALRHIPSMLFLSRVNLVLYLLEHRVTTLVLCDVLISVVYYWVR
jgi:hypothetical protein